MTGTKPTVFHLITGFGVGGAERMLSRVLPRLTNYRHVVISLRGDGPMGEVYRSLGLTTAVLDMRHGADLRAWWRWRALVNKYRPAILTTYLIHADVVGRIFGHLSGIPVIFSSLRARFRGFSVQNLLRLAKFFDPWVSHYIAVSEEVKRYYVNDLHFPAHKFTVVTNGLEPSDWPVALSAEDRRQLLTNLHLPLDAFLVSTVSQLRPEKGVERLIEAMAEAHPRDPHMHCLIIGDGPEQPALELLAKNRGLTDVVHFLGNRQNVAQLLLLSDIFVLPSRFEGMSNALLEAMAAARPIIVTDTPENREVITEETGRLIDTADPRQLGQAIKALAEHDTDRQALGLVARRRLEEYFSLPKKVQQIDELYQRFLPRP